jgi:hypothetical protein
MHRPSFQTLSQDCLRGEVRSMVSNSVTVDAVALWEGGTVTLKLQPTSAATQGFLSNYWSKEIKC